MRQLWTTINKLYVLFSFNVLPHSCYVNSTWKRKDVKPCHTVNIQRVQVAWFYSLQLMVYGSPVFMFPVYGVFVSWFYASSLRRIRLLVLCFQLTAYWSPGYVSSLWRICLLVLCFQFTAYRSLGFMFPAYGVQISLFYVASLRRTDLLVLSFQLTAYRSPGFNVSLEFWERR